MTATFKIGDAVRNLSNTIGFVVGYTTDGSVILTENRNARKNASRWAADPAKCVKIDVDALVNAGVLFGYGGKYAYRSTSCS